MVRHMMFKVWAKHLPFKFLNLKTEPSSVEIITLFTVDSMQGPWLIVAMFLMVLNIRCCDSTDAYILKLSSGCTVPP